MPSDVVIAVFSQPKQMFQVRRSFYATGTFVLIVSSYIYCTTNVLNPMYMYPGQV